MFCYNCLCTQNLVIMTICTIRRALVAAFVSGAARAAGNSPTVLKRSVNQQVICPLRPRAQSSIHVLVAKAISGITVDEVRARECAFVLNAAMALHKNDAQEHSNAGRCCHKRGILNNAPPKPLPTRKAIDDEHTIHTPHTINLRNDRSFRHNSNHSSDLEHQTGIHSSGVKHNRQQQRCYHSIAAVALGHRLWLCVLCDQSCQVCIQYTFVDLLGFGCDRLARVTQFKLIKCLLRKLQLGQVFAVWKACRQRCNLRKFQACISFATTSCRPGNSLLHNGTNDVRP